MITMEIKKLVDAKYGKLAQIEFVKPGVGLMRSKTFLAWGFGIDKNAKVGDSAEITAEEFSQLVFETVELDKVDENGKPHTCLRVKLV